MEALCQRCGEVRQARDQRYCLECGAALPVLDGALPLVRHAWVLRLGWYPGDWALIPAGTLVAALAGAVAAVALTGGATAGAGTTIVADTDAALLRPAPAPVPGATGAGTVAVWPAGKSAWTIILGSYPRPNGGATARAAAEEASKRGLNGVGLLVSSDFPSLQPDYIIVFAGTYPGPDEAAAALGSVRSAGFGGAYTSRIAR